MKTIRIKDRNIKVVGFTNNIISYGRITDSAAVFGKGIKYKLEVCLLWGSLPLYWGPKRPRFRNIRILLMLAPLALALNILLVAGSAVHVYVVGAMNFFTRSSWVDNVREFNWVNTVLVVILSILLVLKW